VAAAKDFPLSITIRTVDRATSGIKRINEQLERSFKPFRKLSSELGSLRDNMGLPQMAEGIRGIGSAVRGVVRGLGVVGAAGGAAVFAFKRMNDEFDNLGDTAERLGVEVNFLSQMRGAAKRNGAEIEALDSSLGSFNKTVGQAKAGTGRFASFLKKVDPIMLRQVKATSSAEGALDLLADAMAKLHGQTDKQTALAVAAGIDPSLIPMLQKGSSALAQLRGQVGKSTGSLTESVKIAGEVDAAWHDMTDAFTGVKASLLQGIGPAFIGLTERAREFFTENREKIAAWAREFGEKLPERLARLGASLTRIKDEAIMPVVRAIGWIVDKLGGAESAVKILIGAWVAFKALQIGGELFKIGQGLVGIVGAATKAAKALRGVGAASGAAGAAGGAAGAGGQLALPFASAGGAGAVGAAGKAGRFARFAKFGRGAMRLGRGLGAVGAAAAAGEAGYSLGSWIDQKTGLSDRISGTGSQLMSREMIEMAMKAGAGKQSEAHVVVELKGAPPGTRTTTKVAGGLELDVDVGYQTMFGGAR
jgi:hypothetical protein